MIKIDDLLRSLRNFIKAHNLALLFAIIIGIIYLAPYIIFMVSLGDKYQGIPIMASANEEFYMARVQEIIDGHPMLGAFAFYEDKNAPSLTPPAAEMVYAIPSILFGISLVKILIISKFVLPFILFLLVYFLINKLTINSHLLSNKLNAIAGAILVTLGYDLVDYRNLWLYLTDKATLGLDGSFLLWARPVNPVIGAVFLFSFLLCVWSIIQKSKYRKSLIFISAVFLSLMITSYFFSWGVAVSVLAVLILMYILKKEYQVVKNFLLILAWTLILTLPYWYRFFKASQDPWYKDAALRSGLFYTHYPLLNKVLIASLLFYFIVFIFHFLSKQKTNKFKFTDIGNWHLFGLSLLLGGIWALNQQIVTGMTVWPYHFVQYTIPFSMVVVLALFYNIIKEWKPFLWAFFIVIIVSASLIFGSTLQVNTYKSNFDYYAGLQVYKPVFDWLNNQEKDSVVLVSGGSISERFYLNGFIAAFTHCNIYASPWAYNLMRPDRLYYSYLIELRLIGVSPDDIEEYLNNNSTEYRPYLFSNMKGLFDRKDFPDFSDDLLVERVKKLPQDYQRFYAGSFIEQLKKYRLDYIVSFGPIEEVFTNEINNPKIVFQSNNIFIYNFK